ncbi:unnamed protein product, partial [Tilletia controversa]
MSSNSSNSNTFWQLPPVKERKGWISLVKTTGEIPQPGPKEVLIKLHAGSLNFRDLIITGEILKLGEGVSLWKKGARVAPIFNRDHLYKHTPTKQEMATGFGGPIDGFLTQYAVVPETALVSIPDYLSFEEAATLTCAAVTAWNGLYGIASEALRPGQTVLVQGTG